MNPAIQLTLNQAFEFLLNVAVVRPVFLWGAPGIGKTALVNRFANELGLECVSLLGSQLAPEDLLGVPQIDGDCSRFYPPANIVRREPFVLFRYGAGAIAAGSLGDCLPAQCRAVLRGVEVGANA